MFSRTGIKQSGSQQTDYSTVVNLRGLLDGAVEHGQVGVGAGYRVRGGGPRLSYGL
jgi:flavin-binding protein dodecin